METIQYWTDTVLTHEQRTRIFEAVLRPYLRCYENVHFDPKKDKNTSEHISLIQTDSAFYYDGTPVNMILRMSL
jgi:hypothetical protein